MICAVVWVGGGTFLTISGLMAVRAKDPHRIAAIAAQAETVGKFIFTPVSFVLLGFGFGMIENGGFGYSATWIQIAIALFGLSAVMGMAFFGPQSARLDKLIGERGVTDAEVQARIKRILLVARFDVLLLLFAVFDMTAKPWS